MIVNIGSFRLTYNTPSKILQYTLGLGDV